MAVDPLFVKACIVRLIKLNSCVIPIDNLPHHARTTSFFSLTNYGIKQGFPERHSVAVKFGPLIREQRQFRLDNVLLLYQTAERGARIVYEFGVGVIAASGPSAFWDWAYVATGALMCLLSIANLVVGS